MNIRELIVGQYEDEFVMKFNNISFDNLSNKVGSSNPPDVVFMFPGYGEHSLDMAKELYEHIDIFRYHLDRCVKIIKERSQFDVIEILYYSSNKEVNTAQFEKHLLSGASLFSIEYALACTLIQLGIRPSAMLGYSMGEYVAACIAEVMTLNDALNFILEQAKHIDTLAPGSMLAVPLSEADIRKYLVKNQVDLAAVNGPNVTILSGSNEAIAKVKAIIRKDKRIECLDLNSSYGFHSYLMEPIMDEVTKIASTIKTKAPQIKYISSVTGDWITLEELNDPYYWARKLRETVYFEQGVQKILKNPSQILLEVGPRQTLGLLVKNYVNKNSGQVVIGTLPHFPGDGELKCFLTTLEILWQEGICINWSELYMHKDFIAN